MRTLHPAGPGVAFEPREIHLGAVILVVSLCGACAGEGAAGDPDAATGGDGGGADGVDSGPVPDGGAGAGSFAERCANPDVIACFGFDTPETTDPYLNDSGHRPPLFDPEVAADGSGSIRMTVAAGSGPDTSGSFTLDFAPGVGEAEALYVQWRQRFSRAFLEADFGPGALGWKQMLIHENTSTAGCSDSEIVVTNTYDRNFPILYHACGIFESLSENPVDGDVYEFDLQPGGDTRCLYSWIEAGLDFTEPSDDVEEIACVGYLPDQWMTFQVGVQLDRWCTEADYASCLPDSRLSLWVSYEGQPSRLVIDWPFALRTTTDPSTTRYDSLQFTPYHTGKDPGVDHPTGELWYDSVVISRARTADP